MNYDRTFLNARREAFVIILLFGLFATWSLTVSYWLGATESEHAVSVSATVLGMPSWVFWGVFLPWGLVNVVAFWFCFGFMTDDDLGENDELVTEADSQLE